MDLKQIEKLMAFMGRTGMRRVMIEEQGFKVELERESEGKAPVVIPEHSYISAPSTPAEHKAALVGEEGGKFVTSPMIGTFYAAPSPQTPAFVKVGDRVEENSVVCIVEAMKVMNEIRAGVSGVVAEVLLKNGNPVEFGTKMFRVV